MTLIDRDEIIDKSWEVLTTFGEIRMVSVIDIEDAPTVDAVPVVRCRDCKFNLANIEDIQDSVNINDGWNACSLTELYDSVFPDDFCSKGERREEKNDNA